MIQIQLNPKLWHVRQPEVTRLMAPQYVDAFFKDGSLRLSSMAQFRSYPDEERGDPREGERHARHTNATGSQFIFINTAPAGGNAYVLSFTASPHLEELGKFGTDGIRVKSTFQFAAAIAASLPDFAEGVEGPCIYTDAMVLDRNVGPLGDTFFPKDGGLRIGGHDQAQALAQMQAGPEFYFKKRTKYFKQCEYRMVWLVTSGVPPFIDLKCPDAVQFCERITGAQVPTNNP